MRILCCAVIASVLLTAAFADTEKKIQRSDLPASVETTVAAQSHGAIIKGFSQESENGKTYYEAEMIVNGHSKDILVAADGSIAEIEEEVVFEALPAEVRAGLQSMAGKGRIVKVECLTKHNKLVAYEAQVRSDGKISEIQVGPDGKPLDHEE